MEKADLLRQKILSPDQLITSLAQWRSLGRKIVFTNGCFDIMHLGHVDYLSKAAGFGDVLIVGLNSDASVKHIKGNSRPIIDEASRAMVLASFFFVDAVVLFNEETPYELIKLIQPDFLVKGSDYKAEEVVGYDIVTAKGGKVVTVDLVPGYSTSLIESKIRGNT
jgi:rfaE bifunctional protein nucleotidyltransferase chain/domain